MKIIRLLVLLVHVLSVMPVPAEKTYYVLGREQGLRGSRVLQMIQLADGRMAVMTESHVNIYDGAGFRSVPIDTAASGRLEAYSGHTHLYVDASHRLWIKSFHSISCIDLTMLQYVRNCKSQLAAHSFDDMFVDSEGGIWTVAGNEAVSSDTGVRLRLPNDAGAVQDIDVAAGRAVVFTDRGEACVFSVSSGKNEGTVAAYDSATASKYARTSLTVKTADGMFHQIRTGNGCSIFQTFSPASMSWKRHFECSYLLHTLMVADGGTAYITTPEGYMTYNLGTYGRSVLRGLRLPDGTCLTTGINTVCRDREGGIWLGTYDRGLLYLPPLSGVFDMGEPDVPLTPVLTSVMIHGRHVTAGRRGMDADAPYLDTLRLDYADNSVAFCFSPVKYVHPRSVCYRYRIIGLDGAWHTADADTDGTLVDNRGLLTLSFVGLSPGSYVMEVMASSRAGLWNGGVRRILFIVAVPWWRSAAAVSVYVLLLAILSVTCVWFYVRAVRRRVAREGREEMLLMRIRDLMEQCNRNGSSVKVVLADDGHGDGKPEMSGSEMEFLDRATKIVEQHIGDAGYTVEQLSRELCMERTGLYRRLTAILDKSPQMFIRSIRLRKAAEMLCQGGMTVTEVADATGFSSSSYFTKCFQKEYGCRPSEYPQKGKCRE